jgi:superfamily II DNA or RNA helicase
MSFAPLKSRAKILTKPPQAVGAAAIYPYSEAMLESLSRTSAYDDDEVYNLSRVVGNEFNRRLWVPRNMAPTTGEDLRVDGLDANFKNSFVARNTEQSRVVAESVALLSSGANFVTQAPTGFGKTYVGAAVIGCVGKKTMVIVTKEDIRDQWTEAFKNVLGLTPGVDLGYLYGDVCDTVNRKVVIAMVQSVAKEGRYPEHLYREFGLVVWDEVHRVGADFFAQSCFRLPAKLRWGISATPDRKDGRGEVIDAHIGTVQVLSTATPMTPRVIVQESPWHIPMKRKLDKEGRLVCDKQGVPKMFELEHSPARAGHVVKILTHHHGRNAMIANFVHQCYKADRKILVQSDTKDHLEMMQTLFVSFGVPPRDISNYVGGMNRASRDVAKEARVILSTYQMTREATDIPDLDTLVMATPKSDIAQIVGRILRAYEGKKEPLVYDIVDASSSVFKSYAASRMKWYAAFPEKVRVDKKPAPKQIDKPVKSTRIMGN